MRRTSSLSAKTPSRSADQKTLHGFFKPKGAVKSDTRDSTPANAVPAVSNLEESSDEDELMATNQLLGPRRSGRKPTGTFKVVIPSPEKGHVKRSRTERDSPPPQVSQYAGSFNLLALLADRNERLEQKQLINKLEVDDPVTYDLEHGSEHDTSTEVSMDHKSGRLEQLLHMSEKQTHPVWCSIQHPQDASGATSPSIPRSLLREFPTRTPRAKDDSTASQDCCAWLCSRVALQGSILSGGSLQFILDCFLASKDIVLVGKVHHALTRSSITLSNISTLLARLMGHGNGSPHQLVRSDKEFLQSQEPVRPNLLLLAKLRVTLRLLCAAVKRGDVDHQCHVDESVVQLVMLLHLDASYGDLLTAELAEFFQNCSSRLENRQESFTSLVALCSQSRDQLRVLQILPVHSPAAVEQTQQLAAMYFLGLKASDATLVESQEQRLRLMLSFLHNSQPFHPLTRETSYLELAQKVALLSHATTLISTTHADLVRDLVNYLQALHGRIVDSKAAFIVRSEAKAAIQRLADRLKYTLEAQRRKSNIFEHFK